MMLRGGVDLLQARGTQGRDDSHGVCNHMAADAPHGTKEPS